MDTNMRYEEIHVECYSGHRVNERPIAFTFQGRRHEIEDILDRWYEGGLNPDRPIVDYFMVQTRDSRVFILRYEGEVDRWSIRTPDSPSH